MLDTLETAISLVGGLFGVLTTIYKLGFKNNEHRIEKYYEKILNPFVVAYKKKKEFDSIKFISKIARKNDYCIPKYIFFLIDQNKKEELSKVLLYDYTEYYKNDGYIIRQIKKNLYKAIIFIVIFESFFALSTAFIYFIQDMFWFIKDLIEGRREYIGLFNFSVNGPTWSFFQLPPFLFMTFVLIACLLCISFLNQDIYTLKESKIKRIVDFKIKAYDKKISKDYI